MCTIKTWGEYYEVRSQITQCNKALACIKKEGVDKIRGATGTEYAGLSGEDIKAKITSVKETLEKRSKLLKKSIDTRIGAIALGVILCVGFIAAFVALCAFAPFAIILLVMVGMFGGMGLYFGLKSMVYCADRAYDSANSVRGRADCTKEKVDALMRFTIAEVDKGSQIQNEVSDFV